MGLLGRFTKDFSKYGWREALNSPEDIKSFLLTIPDFYRSVIKVAKAKIDLKGVVQWRPANTIDFLKQMGEVMQKNKSEYDGEKDETKEMLLREPLYYEMLCLAYDVYGYWNVERAGGWEPVGQVDGMVLNDDGTGLKSCLYKRTKQGRTEYAYAIAGTNPANLLDWENNVAQLCGDSEQYAQCENNAKAIQERADAEGAGLYFTGHSLGGGLASLCALSARRQAVVFNPAGISEETLGKLTYRPTQQDYDALICGFYTTNDLLNLFQDASQSFDAMRAVFPAAVGQRHYLRSKCISPLLSHTMQTVVESFNDAKEGN